MSWSESSSAGSTVKNQCTTKFETHEVDFSWTIENFDFHEANGTDIRSSNFSARTNDKYNWYLLIKPNGKKDTTTKDCITLDICLAPTVHFQPLFAKGSFTFSNRSGTMYRRNLGTGEFTGVLFNWHTEISKNQVLSDNKLMIRCNIVFSEKNSVATNRSLQYQFETPICNLSKNLELLFENQDLSDIIISVKSKDYPVHKCILAARSPVFAAMFKHDTKEKQLNRVNVDDIEENVMDEMLRYIYAGKCENLDSLADGLLVAADKYALDQLKIICSRKLGELLSVENAANVLLTAEMYRVNELKAEAIKFIVGKPVEVFATDGWKNLFSNPQLVTEVCLAMSSDKCIDT